jgi:hypothetical protein
MADIGLMPSDEKNVHSFTAVTADALMKYGSLVVWSGSTDSKAVVTTTSAGANLIAGVVTDQGDPNNSGLHASGAQVTVRDMGVAEVLLLGGATYARGDIIIATTTAGVGGKYTSGSTYDQLGVCLQEITTGTNPQLVSVRLNIVKRAA